MLTSGVFGYLADYLLWWVLFVSLAIHTWCFFRFFPRKHRRRLGLVIGNTLVLACMMGLIALIAESYLRFVVVETDSFGVSLPARRWFALYTKLNSLGCRDREWTLEKPTDVRRIAFVGDSFTYGWGIEEVADRFPDRIQARFEARQPHTIEVMNVAKPGWGTGAQLQPIRDMILRYGVDEVVLCYVPNDIEKLLPTTDEFNPIRPPMPHFFNPDSSCLFDYLYRRIWLPRLPTVKGYHDWLAQGYADPAIWRAQQRRLQDIILYCRSRNATLRVVLLPFLQTQGTKFQSDRLHETLRKFFEANHTPVLDLLPAIAGHDAKDLVVHSADPHPNEKAHKLFADAIWKAFYGENAQP